MAYDIQKPGGPDGDICQTKFDGHHGGAEFRRIAVIGTGIAGLSAAWGLSKAHNVTLLEKANRVGGHSHTVDVMIKGEAIAVDTGFIVYNEANYPNLVALFEHLGVETAESDMSFGASVQEGACEYSGQTLSSMFATRSNIVSAGFLFMLLEIVKFHRLSHRALRSGIKEDITLRQFFARYKFSHRFLNDFIVPMAGAIWSAPDDQILDYPALSFLRFYQNHGLLQVLNMPVWRTVKNGSRHYVNQILADFNGKVRLKQSIRSVTRVSGKVLIEFDNDKVETYDHVVFATHGDVTLSLLGDATQKERSVLGSFQYLKNKAVLHMDDSHMPKKREAWSAWNVLRRADKVAVSYWMNKLQPLDTDKNIFVTLNPITPVADILGEYDYDHPLFNLAACQAQKDIWDIQGQGGVWYCGAHLGSGFHEDGLQSGLAVAEAIGGFKRPWSVANESGRINLPCDNKSKIQVDHA